MGFNGTHVRTEIYGFAPGSGVISCVSTTYPASDIIPPDFLRQPGAKYLGQKMWNNILCDAWVSPPQYGAMQWYTSAGPAPAWVGFATPDGSQIGFFVFFSARVSLPPRIFDTPQGVTCHPLGADDAHPHTHYRMHAAITPRT